MISPVVPPTDVSVMPSAAYTDESPYTERKSATFPGDDRKRVERQYLRFAGVGIQFAVTITVLTLAGIWLDDRAGTGPLFTVVFLLFAFVGGTWSLVRAVLGEDNKK